MPESLGATTASQSRVPRTLKLLDWLCRGIGDPRKLGWASTVHLYAQIGK